MINITEWIGKTLTREVGTDVAINVTILSENEVVYQFVGIKDGTNDEPVVTKLEIAFDAIESVEDYSFTDGLATRFFLFEFEEADSLLSLENINKGEILMNKAQVMEALTKKELGFSEIHSDKDLKPFSEALHHYLFDSGVNIPLSEFTEGEWTPFVDEDGEFGAKATVSIKNLEIQVKMVVFAHFQRDYYIEVVEEPSKQETRIANVDAILLQTEWESGLHKKDIQWISERLSEEEEYVPFYTSENNSSAHGFIKVTALENYDGNPEPIERFVNNIIGDLEKETEDKYYTMENGISLYIGYSLA